MPGIVLGGICRFTIHQTYLGANVANIVDMHLDTDGGAARSEAIEDQAEIINTQWVNLHYPALSSAWGIHKTSWVDLDSADGEVGETSNAQGGVTLPSFGSATGDSLPGNTSYLIRKTTAGGRRGRHGRWYVAGVAESGATGNSMAAGIKTGYVSRLPTFLSNLNQNGRPPFGAGTGLYDSELVVVHEPTGGTPSYSVVSILTADDLLATQRRRLRP